MYNVMTVNNHSTKVISHSFPLCPPFLVIRIIIFAYIANLRTFKSKAERVVTPHACRRDMGPTLK